MIKKKREMDAKARLEKTATLDKKKEDQDKILEEMKTKGETK